MPHCLACGKWTPMTWELYRNGPVYFCEPCLTEKAAKDESKKAQVGDPPKKDETKA
jgi:hypothetical protein